MDRQVQVLLLSVAGQLALGDFESRTTRECVLDGRTQLGLALLLEREAIFSGVSPWRSTTSRSEISVRTLR